jgi:hypothetical protein
MIEDQIGVSEPVRTLGPYCGAGFVDGAAQHRASLLRRSYVRRIWSPRYITSERIKGRLKAYTDLDPSGSHRFGLTDFNQQQQRRCHIG